MSNCRGLCWQCAPRLVRGALLSPARAADGERGRPPVPHSVVDHRCSAVRCADPSCLRRGASPQLALLTPRVVPAARALAGAGAACSSSPALVALAAVYIRQGAGRVPAYANCRAGRPSTDTGWTSSWVTSPSRRVVADINMCRRQASSGDPGRSNECRTACRMKAGAAAASCPRRISVMLSAPDSSLNGIRNQRCRRAAPPPCGKSSTR